MKKFILILIGISLLLGGVIFVIYKNDNDSDDEVVKIFRDIEKEEMEEELKEDKENKEGNSIVVVDIKGMVNNPGVYEVESGKRINDVISMAGGLKEGADTTNINLAKMVFDEMTIIIYSNEEVLEKYKKEVCICDCSYITNSACIANDTLEKNNLVNINTASKEELMSLPNLGESKATAIIEQRKKNGGFKSIDDIKEVTGIGEAIFEKIKDYITV